ncbi:MAG: hypothetical protein ACLR0U_21165 [Enterocloster clostridioformis]
MVTMGIRASMFDFDAILEDSFKDETDIAPATPSGGYPGRSTGYAIGSQRPATPSQARPDNLPSKPAPETPGRRRGHTTGNETLRKPADTGENQTQTSTETLPTAPEKAGNRGFYGDRRETTPCFPLRKRPPIRRRLRPRYPQNRQPLDAGENQTPRQPRRRSRPIQRKPQPRHQPGQNQQKQQTQKQQIQKQRQP